MNANEVLKKALVATLDAWIVNLVHREVSMGHSREQALEYVGHLLGESVCQVSKETGLSFLEVIRKLVTMSSPDSVTHMVCAPILERFEHDTSLSLN